MVITIWETWLFICLVIFCSPSQLRNTKRHLRATYASATTFQITFKIYCALMKQVLVNDGSNVANDFLRQQMPWDVFRAIIWRPLSRGSLWMDGLTVYKSASLIMSLRDSAITEEAVNHSPYRSRAIRRHLSVFEATARTNWGNVFNTQLGRSDSSREDKCKLYKRQSTSYLHYSGLMWYLHQKFPFSGSRHSWRRSVFYTSHLKYAFSLTV